MDIIIWLLVGLAAGALARLLVPGRDPMGIVATIALGLAGSILGGFLARALLDDSDGVGLIGATVGAVVVLLAWNAFVRRERRGTRGFRHRAVG